MERMIEEFIKHHGDTPENLPAFWETWKKAWELATLKDLED
jgi:hypothetical protein